MFEVTESERQLVLGRVGTSAMEEAIHEEGMLVTGSPMTADWRKAKNWAKRKAFSTRVPFHVLYVILADQLYDLICEEASQQKKLAYFDAEKEAAEK